MNLRTSVWWRKHSNTTLLVTLLTLLLLLLWRPHTELQRTVKMARVNPSLLADVFADFNTQRFMHPNIKKWSVEDETSNGSSWVYKVKYNCGDQCHGSASVHAHNPHSVHDKHAIQAVHTICQRGTIFFWTENCENWEWRVAVETDGDGGASITEFARLQCGILQTLRGGCQDELRLRLDNALRQTTRLLRVA